MFKKILMDINNLLFCAQGKILHHQTRFFLYCSSLSFILFFCILRQIFISTFDYLITISLIALPIPLILDNSVSSKLSSYYSMYWCFWVLA